MMCMKLCVCLCKNNSSITAHLDTLTQHTHMVCQSVCSLMKSAVLTSSAKHEEQHNQSSGAAKPLASLYAMFFTHTVESNNSQLSLPTDSLNCPIITAAGSDFPPSPPPGLQRLHGTQSQRHTLFLSQILFRCRSGYPPTTAPPGCVIPVTGTMGGVKSLCLPAAGCFWLRFHIHEVLLTSCGLDTS